ncbi:class I SAM-dependent methyltransferase [Ancylobacter sp. WKF20]|uniref:class I SAM-dependent methyltransferase n=1 Tax=Ancylobacter sp. WKF20 TaxID=3039801 RepID=UPI0024346776|nr:class I SAM-dependent methyltransferase [Ancylobacter sp. WKF20]WGD30031.1 class I SAM-dependent methyltransferase [Ancylobacter sp. WKF20]
MPLNTHSSPGAGTGSTHRFGYEWGHYSEMRPLYETQFRRWTPFMAPEDWVGKTFIDVGCGMGRNSYWPMTYGAAGGLAIDLDENSLASARRNLAPFPTLAVERCSAYELDGRSSYDIAFSIGVIHHVEDPDLALANMVRSVKPGGLVMIWVYGLENNRWIVHFFSPLRRLLFSRLPIGVTHAMSVVPAALLWLALRLGLSRIEYFRLIRQFDFAHLRSIVFDQMLPEIAHYWSRDEVEALMRRAGLADVELSWVNEMSWAAKGRRPVGGPG